MRGEIVMLMVEMEKARKGNAEDYTVSLLPSAYDEYVAGATPISAAEKQHFSAYIGRSEAVALWYLRRLAAVADRPYPEVHSAFVAATADLNSHRTDSAYNTMRIASAVYRDGVMHRAQVDAMRGIARASSALFAWKASHGNFPDSLSTVMDHVPVDPFDLNGKPLRYKREGSGYVLYSVGPSLKFDGGSAAAVPAGVETVFRFPQPAYEK